MNAATLRRLAAPIAAMPARDRRLLAALVPAAALALELLVAQPAQTRRAQAEAATAQDQQGRGEAIAAEKNQADEQRQKQLAQRAALKAELSTLGAAKPTGGPLSAVLEQAIVGHGLQMLGMRGLPVEELALVPIGAADTAASANRDSASPVTAPAADLSHAEASATAAAQPKLFRHRLELTLSGPSPQLLQSLDSLSRRLAPLRLHSVTLQPGEPGEVRAILVLGAIGSEKTWLEI